MNHLQSSIFINSAGKLSVVKKKLVNYLFPLKTKKMKDRPFNITGTAGWHTRKNVCGKDVYLEKNLQSQWVTLSCS